MLGKARLKGLDNAHVLEVIDGEIWRNTDLAKSEERGILEALESEFRQALERSSPTSPLPSGNIRL